jgi:S1-C subfamily serine protease
MATSGGGWTCPKCQRQVPGSVITCRCGGAKPPVWAADVEEEASTGRRIASILVPVLVVLACGTGIAFWYQHPYHPTVVSPVGQGLLKRALSPSSATTGVATTPASAPKTTPDPVAPLTPPPPDGGAPSAGPSIEDMVAAATPAVVAIESDTARGTGFYVRPDLIVTNAYVVRGSTTVKIKFADNRSGEATVTMIPDGIDLALLRPSAGSEGKAVLQLSSIAHVRPGQEVIAIGSALGVLQNTVTRGIVSAMRQDGGVMLLQTDAAINPGNSGGPLLDRSGRVVGVNTMKVGGATSIGFALAADHVKRLIEAPAGQRPPSFDPQTTLVPEQPAAPAASGPHAQAVASYERQLHSIAGRADQLDEAWDRFKATCNGAASTAMTGDREWFGVWVNRPSVGVNMGDCSSGVNEITRLANSVRVLMSTNEEIARRAGVYPGETRELRHKYRLEWDHWGK